MNRRILERAAHAARHHRPRRLPRQQHPDSVAAFYRAHLYAWIQKVRKLAFDRVLPQARAVRVERLAQMVHDDWAADFSALIFGFEEEAAAIPIYEVPLTTEVGNRVADFQQIQWSRQVRAAFGVDVTLAEPWLRPAIKAFSVQNSTLIKSMKEDAIKRVSSWAAEAVRSGGRAEDMRKALQKQFAISKRKADLIARDQVGKLNADITQTRQMALGVDEYRWRGVMDSRERPEHVAREGKKFKWSKPPEDGHPGQPIRCRCNAEPVLTGLLDLKKGDL